MLILLNRGNHERTRQRCTPSNTNYSLVTISLPPSSALGFSRCQGRAGQAPLVEPWAYSKMSSSARSIRAPIISSFLEIAFCGSWSFSPVHSNSILDTLPRGFGAFARLHGHTLREVTYVA